MVTNDEMMLGDLSGTSGNVKGSSLHSMLSNDDDEKH